MACVEAQCDAEPLVGNLLKTIRTGRPGKWEEAMDMILGECSEDEVRSILNRRWVDKV